MSKAFSSPLAPLIFFAIGAAILNLMHPWMGYRWSERYEVMMSFGWRLAILSWMTQDAQRNGRTPYYDYGFFAFLIFPLSVIIYAGRHYGSRGVLILGLIFLLTMVLFIPATIMQ